MAARRALSSARPTSSPISIGAGPASRASPRSARNPDTVKILSGVFTDEATGKQVTTGTPIALVIDNVDQRTKDYADIKDKYRPGHADYTYDIKYGLRDYRGGGRQSARETAMRVAAGAIARKVVPGLQGARRARADGPAAIDRTRCDWAEVERNPFFCPDAERAAFFAEYLDGVRKRGSSVGAVIEIVAEGVPPGLGAPIYGKLDADLAAALMSINAVKGVEIGAGFAAAELCGEENADEMRMGNDGKPIFLCNNAGGILGGISTGQPVIARFAVKPTSSILTRGAPSTATATRPKSPPPAATTPASASAPCRLAKPWWRASSPITICAIAARSARRRIGRFRCRRAEGRTGAIMTAEERQRAERGGEAVKLWRREVRWLGVDGNDASR